MGPFPVYIEKHAPFVMYRFHEQGTGFESQRMHLGGEKRRGELVNVHWDDVLAKATAMLCRKEGLLKILPRQHTFGGGRWPCKPGNLTLHSFTEQGMCRLRTGNFYGSVVLCPSHSFGCPPVASPMWKR